MVVTVAGMPPPIVAVIVAVTVTVTVTVTVFVAVDVDVAAAVAVAAAARCPGTDDTFGKGGLVESPQHHLRKPRS